MRERSSGNTVAVIGGTGREHALVDQYAESIDVDRMKYPQLRLWVSAPQSNSFP